MRELNCEYVRDLLPDRAAGEVAPELRHELEAHLARCAECRAEAELVRRLQHARAPLPVGLEARVLAAAASRPGRRRAPYGGLALAATFAAAVIGGSLLFDRGGRSAAGPERPEGVTATESLPVLEDPLLRGGSWLGELTEAELAILLENMES